MTRSGWYVLAFGVVLTVGGALAHYGPLVALGAACLLALGGAVVWMLARPELSATRVLEPERISEDDSTRAILSVQNVGRRRALPTVAAERIGGRELTVSIPSIPPGATHRSEYALPPTRRGRHQVGPLIVGRTDPFHLLRIERVSCLPTTLWVHPRAYRVNPLPAGVAQDMDGPTSAGAPRGGVAFYGLREYIPGDDLRNIHWRSTARTGTLMVRENVVPHRPQLVVVLDTDRGSYRASTAFEEAVRVAASLCYSACAEHHPVELRTTGGARANVRAEGGGLAGDQAWAPLLDELAVVRQNETSDDRGFAPPAQIGRSTGDRSGSVAVVTGRPTGARLASLRRLKERHGFMGIVAIGAPRDLFISPVPSALVVNVPTADRFAAVWNAKVPR